MRQARAALRAAALRTAIAALQRAGTAPEADAAAALQERLLREAESAPLWPPAERARLLRTRQWICLLAFGAAAPEGAPPPSREILLGRRVHDAAAAPRAVAFEPRLC